MYLENLQKNFDGDVIDTKYYEEEKVKIETIFDKIKALFKSNKTEITKEELDKIDNIVEEKYPFYVDYKIYIIVLVAVLGTLGLGAIAIVSAVELKIAEKFNSK